MAGDEADAAPTPRWVKVFALVVLVVVVLVAVILVVGGDHGPRRHAADAGRVAATSSP